MESQWENKSMEFCREQLGESAFRERLAKNQKNKPGAFGGKLSLNRSCTDAKKLSVSGTSLYRRYHSVGATGYAVVLKDKEDRVPPNDFFQPGRRFRVRFRHSSLGCSDDAGSCIREAAVKFADQNEDGPLDLVMYTGRTALARNSHTLVKVLKAKTSLESLRSMCHEDPNFFFSFVDGLRRSPPSFSNLKYHSQLAYQFKLKNDQDSRIARFRLVPCNGEYAELEEQGQLDRYEQTKPWVTKRKNAEKRSVTYLRDEFIQRLHQDEPVKYKLQVQFYNYNYKKEKGDKEEMQPTSPWNPQKSWNEKESPWIDLIAIKLTTFLPVRALNRTYFNIVERPACLSFLPPASSKDFLSYQKAWCDIHTMCEIKHVSQAESERNAEVTGSTVAALSDFIPYTVLVSTSSLKKDVGVPKVDLYVTLIGTESRSTPVHLERLLELKEKRKQAAAKAQDEPASKDFHDELYEIEAERVGVVLALSVAVRHRQLTDEWYLRHIVLTDQEGIKSRFPCHSVVNSDIVLRTGDVCLRQKEQFEVHRQERLFELCERKQLYLWAPESQGQGSTMGSRSPLSTSSQIFLHSASVSSSTSDNLHKFSADNVSKAPPLNTLNLVKSISNNLDQPMSDSSEGAQPLTSTSSIESRERLKKSLSSYNSSRLCGHIKARTVDQLPIRERLYAVKYTGLHFEVDIKLMEFFRTLNFANTTTGAKLRAKTWMKETTDFRKIGAPAANFTRKFSTMGQFSVLRTPSVGGGERKETRALQRWKQLSTAIQEVRDMQIPDGSRGEMCQIVRNDSRFGRLFLAGPHPLMIKRCQQLPQNFPVTQAMVEGSLQRSRRLDQEMRDGYVYIADYAVLEGIKTIHRDADHRYLAAPLVLFYVRSGDLIPIAIQLQQTPSVTNPIWTPNDRPENWILAKLWVRSCDFQVHFAVSHMFKCHTLMEPFVVATMRQLPTPHPVYKLLRRHFRCFLVTNTMMRTNILRRGSPIEKFTSLGVKGFKSLVQKYLENFTFNEMFPLRDLETRGVSDTRKLPNYFYRDDAVRLWNTMRTFCEEILKLYYNDDEDLKNDEEIQNWIKAIHEHGLPNFTPQQLQGLPASFDTLDDLVEVVTMIMFTLTCAHSATHSDALDLYGYIPDAPAMMRQPPPADKKAPIDRAYFAAVLPDQYPDAYYGSLALAMLVYEPDENVLSQSAEVYFTEPKSVAVVEKFMTAIKKINVTIRARNTINRYLYEHLLPESIPLSAEPIPFVPRKVLKKTLVLSPEMTRELIFGGQSANNGIRAAVPCMSLPVCVQFAHTLGGRSFMARREGGFDMYRSSQEEAAENRRDVTDGAGTRPSSGAASRTGAGPSRIGSFSALTDRLMTTKAEMEKQPIERRLCTTDV